MIKHLLFTRNVLLLGLLILAFALRLYKVTSVPLSLDEMYTIGRYVPLSIIDILTTHHSNNQPMASLLAHLFSPQANHLFMMRWPMILLGTLSISFVYRLGADLFCRSVGVWAALLMAISPIHLAYSVVIRGYGGLMLLTTISLYFLWYALRYNRWYAWLGFVVVNILVIYFHMFGAFAAGMQLGLVGLWLFWELNKGSQNHLPILRQQPKSTLIKFGIAALLLVAVCLPLIHARTTSIFSEGGYPGEFEVWRDGLSWPEDISPFVLFLGMMSPMSPGGIGAYLYLAFGIVGLIVLWHKQQILAIAAVIWLFAPVLAIFVAMKIFGEGFFAYVRFLLYQLSPILILVAAGIVGCANWLSTVMARRGWQWQAVSGVIKWSGVVGLLTLAAISTNWYVLRSVPTNWPGVADVLSRESQPQDITICEEYQQGFDVPDRAKAYCIWMLDFFVPELQGYTPRFQNSLALAANYNQLREQRAMMLEPGNVWLVIWQKIVFNPSHLITDEMPSIAPSPPLSEFAPYQAWQFGSATLVHIDSEETRFGNVYKALELLSQIEQAPADRARYYRSLAEMEAIQGNKQKAYHYFKESWALVESAGEEYPESFLGETRQVIERIPDSRLPTEAAFQVGYQFGPSLCLSAHEVAPKTLEAGQTLLLTLYWQTLDFVNESYGFYLRLDDKSGQTYAWLLFEPFERVYPISRWWANQRLAEHREFHIPADLFGQNYIVQLGVFDRQFPDNEVVKPLFLMSYRPDAVRSVHWDVQPFTHLSADCP